MSFWMSTYFMDANSPVMEHMVFFHDSSMTIIIMIILFLFLNMLFIKKMKNIFLNLNENQTIEMVWTVIPMFMLLFIALPSLRLLYLMEEDFNPNLTFKVMGHQWYWSYEFSDLNLSFDSFMKMDIKMNNFRLLETDNYVYLPLNNSIRALVTSLDVIHSWTIPSMGVKTDAVPGRLNQINMFTYRSGVYFGQCSEICGANHSFMPISLKIVPMKYFLKWVKLMK